MPHLQSDQAPHGDDCREDEQWAKVELRAGIFYLFALTGEGGPHTGPGSGGITASCFSLASRSTSHRSNLIPPARHAGGMVENPYKSPFDRGKRPSHHWLALTAVVVIGGFLALSAVRLKQAR
jgi:hypothetical protein